MTALEKVNASAALLIKTFLLDTNATNATMVLNGLSYKGKKLGNYKLTIEPYKEVRHEK